MSNKYSDAFRKRNTSLPLGTIAQTVRAIDESSGNKYSDFFRRGANTGMQGADVVGSKLMEFIEPLAKPLGASSGLWKAIGDTGPKITPEGIQGPSSMFEKNVGSVTDDITFPERAIEEIKKGWDEPFREEINPADVITDFLPEDIKETTLGKVGVFAANVGAGMAIDPLTATPGVVVSAPFNIAKAIMRAAGATKPVKSVLQSGPVSNVLEALNIYTGDAAKAQKIINDVRLESRGVEIKTGRQLIQTNRELQRIAAESGVSVDSLKAAILNASETGDMTKLAKINANAVKYAEDDIKFYEDLIATENRAGLDTADITRIIDPDTGLTRAQLLSLEGGQNLEHYVPHVSAKHDTFTSKIKKLLTGNRSFMNDRTIAGTIDEINTARGTKFFMDDPAVLKIMRQRWSNQAMLGDRAVAKAGEQFGTLIGKPPKGSKGLFDANGNPIPDDWVKIKDHAFPPGIGKPLLKQYKILKSPKATREVIAIYDEVQNWWKKYSLASRPAWHTRNAFSNFWNNYFLGGLTNPLVYGEAAAIQKAMQLEKGSIVSRLDAVTGLNRVDQNFVVSGTGMTRKEIFDEAIKRGVYEAGMYGQDLGEAALKQSNVWFSTEWKGINKAFAAGKAVENNARLALFIDSIRKGRKGVKGRAPVSEDVLDKASMNVRGSLFDYSDLSDVERRYMKRWLPFYTWTRKNIPAQLAGVLKHPDRANKLNIIVGNAQRGVGDIDENDVEDWVKGQFPIFLNAKDSDDFHTFFTAMSYLPTAELERFFGENKVKALLDMVSPILKLPVETFTNYNMFRQDYIDFSQIEPFALRGTGEGFGPLRSKTVYDSKGDPMPKGSEEFLGMRVTPKEKHILSSLVLLGEIDRLNPFNIFGEAENTATGDIPKKSWAGVTRQGEEMLESARWVRAILGARLYKRDKGRAEMSRMSNEQKMLITLEKKLDSNKAAGNEVVREHLMQQIRQILGRGRL